MLYYSTNHKSVPVDFRTATIDGLAPDGGLYFPERIPKVSKGLIDNIEQFSNEHIALEIIKPYLDGIIPEIELDRIVRETIDFNFPLVPLKPNIFSLELFHGPTLAFKDVGARFMSRCLGYFVRDAVKKVTVLVATSGDTGGAVADGFYNVDGVQVVILYPKGKVSHIQELQLTTHGKNIHAIEINGTFDDCQKMVKQAFSSAELKNELFLTSANSINIARWLPQQFYYFFGYKLWHNKSQPPAVSVPSGNFGNICAGLLAYLSGLPFRHFIASCNANDVIPNYLTSGIYEPRSSVSTISNAMDVGDPSNWIRILELFGHDLPSLKKIVTGYSFTDTETKNAIKNLFDQHNYISDPHGAVAFLGLEKYLSGNEGSGGFFLETAHPVKFLDVVENVLNQQIPLPVSVSQLLSSEKKKKSMEVSFADLKEYLISGI